MIKSELIDRIAEKVASVGVSEQTVMALRAEWPDVHFTYCMDDDIAGKQPVRQEEAFNLYLVDASAHCLSITSNEDVATGLVIAEKLEWDEED